MAQIYKFNEHNEAFYFWQKAKQLGAISKPVDLFHIDAHPDMGYPQVLRKSVNFLSRPPHVHDKYYADFAQKELNIDNFIIPAVLCGLIKNVYFIYPAWRKLKRSRRKMSVSSAFGEGKLIKYGINLHKSNHQHIINKAFPDTPVLVTLPAR